MPGGLRVSIGGNGGPGEALTLFRAVGGVWGEANASMVLATMARAEGRLKHAARLHADSLRLRRDAGVLTEAFDNLVGIAKIAQVMEYLEPQLGSWGPTTPTVWCTAPADGGNADARKQTKDLLITLLGDARFTLAWTAGLGTSH